MPSRDNREVEREDYPIPPALDYVPIVSAIANHTCHFVCLSAQPVGVWTHYVDERTIPCVGRERGCICRVLDVGRRWKGYLAAWDPGSCRIVLVEVTIEAYRHQEGKAFMPGNNLRGKALSLFRIGAAKRSPVRVCFGSLDVEAARKLPEAPDVMAALQRVWGAPSRA